MPITVYVDGNRRADLPAGDSPGKEEFHFEPGVIHVFTSDAAKAKWLNSSGFAVYYQRGRAVLADLRREVPQQKRREKSLARTAAEEEAAHRKTIQRLLARHNVTPDSKEFAKILTEYAAGGRTRPLTTILYDSRQYTGEWRSLRHGLRHGDLGWIRFNNRTTSLRVFGETTILFNDTWWRGAQAWFGGHPYWEEDLSGRWWDNRASSIIIF